MHQIIIKFSQHRQGYVVPSPLSQVNGEFVLNFICTAYKNLMIDWVAICNGLLYYVFPFLPLLR